MTQSILIGSPLELTRKGIIELHKLKNEETYIYLASEENLPFSPDSKVYLVSEEDYIYANIQEEELTGEHFNTFFILPFYLMPYGWHTYSFDHFAKKAKEQTNKLEMEMKDTLYFTHTWLFPKDEDRTDKELLQLYYNNKGLYFTENTRKIVIPKDVKWKICSTYPFDREYIQEKARTWG